MRETVCQKERDSETERERQSKRIETDGQTDRQTDRQTNKQISRETNIQTKRKADKQKTDRKINWQRDYIDRYESYTAVNRKRQIDIDEYRQKEGEKARSKDPGRSWD